MVNTGAGPPATVAGFTVSPFGALASLGIVEGPRAEFARTDLTVSRDGKYLYVLAPQVAPPFPPSHIDAFAIGTDGSLTFVGTTPAAAGLGIGASGLAAS